MEPKDILILIDKLQHNTITAEELEQVRRIFHRTQDTKKLIELMKQTYDQQMGKDAHVDEYENQLQVRNRLIESTLPNAQRVSEKGTSYYRIAALIAIFFFVGGLLYFTQRSTSPNMLELTKASTKPGERKKLRLQDGSTILLNGNSSLWYPKFATKGFRMVKLEGEAFFEIASDKQKPFIVIADRFTTQVVGTSFNIDTDNNQSVQVNTGSVHVFTVSNKDVLRTLADNDPTNDNLIKNIDQLATDKIALTPGEKAQFNASGRWDITPYYLKNWKDNELTYINEPIEKVVRNLYRNFGDSIVLDPSFLKQKITITLRNKSNLQVLNTLTELCNGQLILNKEKKIWQINKH